MPDILDGCLTFENWRPSEYEHIFAFIIVLEYTVSLSNLKNLGASGVRI